ncbi:MAG TPA: S8 family serine peptidase, partial [Flavobacteriales bacterium]|nr:S8 family serine peptidase [Flavobacteriales bacterium]
IFDGQKTNFMTIKYNPDGKLEWEKEYDGLNGDDEAKDVRLSVDGKVYVTGTSGTGTNAAYSTVKYSYLKKDNGIVYDDNGQPYCMDNELIVKFRPAIVNTDIVDDQGWQYGELQKVVGDSIAQVIMRKLGIDPNGKPLIAFKIYKRLTTADSISISRTGNEVRVPKFWSSFLLQLDHGLDLVAAKDSLSQLTQYIDYAEVNGLGTYTSVPDDPYFSIFQGSLIPNVNYPNASINLDGAWDVQTGKPYVKVGVYDDPVYWAHEDFGDGSYSGSKVKGYDYYHGTDLSNVNDPPNSHGTAVAGVIGALRNNGTGVAGIAGGDVEGDGNTGAALYSMAIFSNNSLASATAIANA